MPLRLLHLSDIHFQGYDAGWDEDDDQRGELLRDLAPIVASDGPMDGVLVGGDIAFSARDDQYDTACQWLDKVLQVCGNLDRSRVWTVPGNHDVDIGMLKKCVQAREFRTAIRSCGTPALDWVLKERLSQDPGASSLMLPLQQYNQFAALFGCSVPADKPQWFDETLAFDGWNVRLTGLNTVLTSDLEDDTSPYHQLVLGSQQCRLPRKDGMLHIVMAHHPPSWLRDWPIVEPYLLRAQVWLFGHEHAYAARQVGPGGSVEICAGAVGPERTDEGEVDPFVPTYNVISLQRCQDEVLEVKVQSRYWLRAQTRFGEHPDGVSIFRVDVDSRDTNAQVNKSVDQSATATEGETPENTQSSATAASPLVEELPEHPAPDVEKFAERRDLRRLGVKFMDLPVVSRRQIGRTLGVLEDDDLQLPAVELYPLLLTRIRERNLIDALSVEVGE